MLSDVLIYFIFYLYAYDIQEKFIHMHNLIIHSHTYKINNYNANYIKTYIYLYIYYMEYKYQILDIRQNDILVILRLK